MTAATQLLAKGWMRTAVTVAVLVVAAVMIPPLLSPAMLDILVLSAIYAIIAVGLDVLMGYTGLESLGQAAFFGTAAYSLGILTTKYDWGWFAAAGVGLGACLLLSGVFGVLAVRLRGLYFLLITLALGQVLWGGVQRWGGLTGGFNGLTGVPAPLDSLIDPVNFAYCAIGVFAVVLIAARLIVTSPFGLALRGCRDDELRLRTLGFRATRVKWIAFVIAAMAAGLAGLLNASYTNFVSPSDVSLQTSFAIMLMVIAGGAGTIYGAVLGAAVITFLQYKLSVYTPDWWLMILGGIYVFTALVLPNGLAGALREHAGRFTRRRAGGAAPVGLAEPAEPDVSESAPEAPEESDGVTRLPVRRSGGGGEILKLDRVNKAFGGFAALTDVSLSFSEGERTAIIGPNGAGKTTLFNTITGLEPTSSGSITLFGVDVTKRSAAGRPALGMGRTFQVTKLFPPLTVADNMLLGLLGWTARSHQYTMWRPARHIRSLQEQVAVELERSGLLPYRDVVVSELSYGHQKQLDIALALAAKPRLLLLDEPTAGLSESEARTMRALVASLPDSITVLIIEHNLDFVFGLTERAIVLDHGQVLMEGPQDVIRGSDEVKRIYFGEAVA